MKKANERKTSRRRRSDQYQSAPTVQTPRLPPTEDQIRQRAHDLYVARGGAEGMALDDWLKAEEELRREIKDIRREP